MSGCFGLRVCQYWCERGGNLESKTIGFMTKTKSLMTKIEAESLCQSSVNSKQLPNENSKQNVFSEGRIQK